MLDQIQRYGSIRPQGIGRSAGQVRMEALANLGKNISNAGFGMLAEKRQEQGKLEGLKAGQEAVETGEIKEQKSLFPSIYEESFNNAQQAAYLAGIDRQAVERLSELENEFSHDPEAFQKSAQGMLEGYVKNAPESYKYALNDSIGKYVSSGTMRINNNVVQRGKEEAKSELLGAIDTYSREASRAARNGDVDAVQDFLEKADSSAQSLVESGEWTKEQEQMTSAGLRRDIYKQENRRDILELAESKPEKAFKLLQEQEKADVPASFTPDEWERHNDSIRTDLARMMPRKSGASKKQGDDWLKKAKNSLTNGFALSESDKAEGAALLGGTEKQDEYVQLLKMEQFSLLSSKQRNDVLSQMASADDLDLQQNYIALQAVHNKLTKLAEDDGMSLAQRQGLLEPAPLSDIDARNEQAEELSERFGVTVGPYRETEIQELVASMGEMTANEKADLAMTIGDNERTYQQLDKKNASLFAMLSATGNRDLANSVFLGEELVKTKQFKLPPPADFTETVEDYLGDVGEVYGVQDRETIIKAAKYHYATTGDEIFDDSAFEKSLEAITGGIAEINGRRVELPENIDEDELDDFINEIQPETLEHFGGLLHPFPIEDVRDAQLVSVGKNKYQLEINGMRQYNKSKQPFEITVTPEILLINDQSKPKRNRRGR